MKKLLALSICLLLSACGGGSGNPHGGSGETPKQGNTPNPATIPEPESYYPDFTDYGISEMKRELSKIVWESRWQDLSIPERQVLAGASLDQAARNLKADIDWKKVSEKDLARMMRLFFNEDYSLKR